MDGSGKKRARCKIYILPRTSRGTGFCVEILQKIPEVLQLCNTSGSCHVFDFDGPSRQAPAAA